ncbi:type II toxin-antitoxin system VapC family toxin [Novosphingobium album (ex Liu et al. 2023)]|uniref:Ribonuclease VapC n=1 Tax=Novosphingobium album (ex Liu et al. 2023) TaxID=3031130 RepID=A0ABT5WSE5_9SPHN|nr:type II toxin-antitoxin system VapC family toxin [Novosphingobium album (ex Liu et al. 2023)]MDE8652971.1 type II toxin-antitoxin system VapC family toxin [Novosphingobium album (ex Liu et al. 2023)]
MKRIVDTSVAIKWFVIEADHEAAKALIGQDLVAPDILVAEMSNAIWKKCRLGQMDRAQAALAQSMVGSFIELLPSVPLAERALRIAIELDHPVYDCFFLALGEMLDLRVMTADRRLATRCQGSPFAEQIEVL